MLGVHYESEHCLFYDVVALVVIQGQHYVMFWIDLMHSRRLPDPSISASGCLHSYFTKPLQVHAR